MNRAPLALQSLSVGLLACLMAACSAKPPATVQAVSPALETMTVGAEGVASGPGWDGVVEAVQQAVISAQTSGRVASVEADVNDRVAAGATMLRLAGVEQKAGLEAAQAQLKSAEAVLAEAESRHRRASELVGRQLMSKADYDFARAARDSALAARDGARAIVQQASQAVDYTVVRAPYAGIVSARRVEPGEAVVPGQPLFSFYAPGALRVAVQVPQSVAAALRASPRARLLGAQGLTIDGGAVTVYPSADPLSHSVTVRVAIPAKQGDGLAPGSTVKVQFPGLEEGSPLRSVPKSAVVQRGEVSAVYVLEGNELSLRQVRLGDSSGDSVEVIAGLTTGDRIVLDPVAALQWLTRKRSGKAGSHE